MTTRPILIVEDDQAIREALITTFEFIGRQNIIAKNGKEAIDILSSLRDDELPACIILDLMMPKMSGQEFIFQIQALGRQELDCIPIIVSSASKAVEDFEDPRVRYVLKKPVELDEIERMVSYYV